MWVILILIIVVFIIGKFIYDTYLTDNTEKNWETYRQTNPEDASRIDYQNKRKIYGWETKENKEALNGIMKKRFPNFFNICYSQRELMKMEFIKDDGLNLEFKLPTITYGKIMGFNHIGIEDNLGSYYLYMNYVAKNGYKVYGKKIQIFGDLTDEKLNEYIKEFTIYMSTQTEYLLLASGIEVPNIEWVDIPSGTFIMGSPIDEEGRGNNEIQRVITLSAFKMSKYTITFDQYDMFCKSTGAEMPNDEGWGRGNRPVIRVNWDDAVAFADWVGCRLPTEAEWEYSCRAGTTTPYNTGDCIKTSLANYNGKYPLKHNSNGRFRKKTMPVGSFPPNAWGLYDMHGNVMEWCKDLFWYYPIGPQTNPAGPLEGCRRVIRGGGWSWYAHDCRSAHHFGLGPGHRDHDVGFRIVSSF